MRKERRSHGSIISIIPMGSFSSRQLGGHVILIIKGGNKDQEGNKGLKLSLSKYIQFIGNWMAG